VLHDVTFGARRGEHIALVGATGAGKSTVASLLLRLYEPQAGAVRVLGQDVRFYEPHDLRRNFSVVPQDVFLFTGTILSNVAMSDPHPDRAKAERALARGFDHTTDALMRPFFYLPFMHSEQLADQQRCVRLYQALGDAELLRYAVAHHDIIAKFGRFPHRNRALNRDTTSAEQAFLDGGGFAG